jgi:hypothetical protein
MMRSNKRRLRDPLLRNFGTISLTLQLFSKGVNDIRPSIVRYVLGASQLIPLPRYYKTPALPRAEQSASSSQAISMQGNVVDEDSKWFTTFHTRM